MLQYKSQQAVLQPKLKQATEVINEDAAEENNVIKTTSSRPLVVVFTVSFLLFLLSLFFILFVEKRIDNWALIIFFSLVIWTFIYVLAAKNAKNSYFLLSTAIIFILSVFHLSHVGLHALGLYDFPLFADKEMGYWYQSASWLVMLAIASFGLGLSFTGGTLIYNNEKLMNSPTAVLGRSLCWWYGVGLFLAAMFSLALLFYSAGNIFAYSRIQIFAGIGDTRGFGLFQMFLPSSMILLMLGATTNIQRYVTYSILVIFGLGILLMGYRSVVMFPILIGVILWVKTGRKLNKLVVVSGLIFLIIAIPTVRYFRALGAYDTLSTADLTSSVEQAKVDDIFIELGSTSNVVAYVMKWVPEEENYRYGYTYWLGVKNALPNMGLNISNTDRAIIKDAGSDITDLSASNWFIYRYNRWLFDTGGGAGFSMVAEPYLNFGVPGVIVFFILLGYIIGRLDSINLLLNPIVLLLSAAILWPLIRAIRNDFSTFLKPASFILIVFLLWKLVTFWKEYRARKRQAN